MASETMALNIRIAPWMMPVLWGLLPVFLVVGEKTRRKIIVWVASRAIHVC